MDLAICEGKIWLDNYASCTITHLIIISVHAWKAVRMCAFIVYIYILTKPKDYMGCPEKRRDIALS